MCGASLREAFFTAEGEQAFRLPAESPPYWARRSLKTQQRAITRLDPRALLVASRFDPSLRRFSAEATARYKTSSSPRDAATCTAAPISTDMTTLFKDLWRPAGRLRSANCHESLLRRV